ncbi:MAG: hypothetical protein M3R38_31640 [Actinomycetota bacterium]|nr:hypothetical protein [Actinomycetota bacterium]
MTEQENTSPETTTTETTIHPMTRKSTDTSLVKRQISPDSHRAILTGELSLEEARSLGREGSPFGPTPKTVAKNDRSRLCLCGCQGASKTGRFVAGHDQRMVTYAKEYVRGERELTEEQLEYVESSGKLERAKRKVSEEERQRQERIAKKAEAQRRKEGEMERRRAEKEADKKPKK